MQYLFNIWRFVFTRGEGCKKWYIFQNVASYDGTIRKNLIMERMVTDKVTTLFTLGQEGFDTTAAV